MDLKRKSHHEGNENDKILAHDSKRSREDSQKADTCIIRFGNLRPALHIKNDIEPHMTKMIQRVVREVVERKLVPSPSAAKFELVFNNALPATIYTHSKIKAEDGWPVEIALRDTRSQSIVTDGPLSSIKIKICVLNGEFDSNGWNTDEFKANISRERDNKGKLLKGDEVFALNKGISHIDKIMFTDNSKCTRSRHFRLGAMVQPTSDEGNIKEAISNRFMVKDSRGESNQKHYPPSLSDEVWRLKYISKRGKVHNWLSDELGINTVKDLLQLYETSPSSLQEKFGKNSARLQETIKHAKTCNPEVTSGGQNYRSQNTLNSYEKLEMVKQHAYINVKDSIPLDKTSAQSFPDTLASQQIAAQCSAPHLQVLDLPTAQQAPTYLADQLEIRQGFSQPSTSTSHICEAADINNRVGSEESLVGMRMEENDLYLLGSHVPNRGA